MKVHIYYRTEKLNEIIKNLGELLGISILVLDSKAQELARYSIPYNYCTTMQSSPEFKNKCSDCDRKILKKCMESSKIEAHYCHAGLCDVAMPITKDGIIAAYVILGRIRASNSPKNSIYGQENGSEELYSRLTTFTDKQLENLTELLPYIVFDSAIVLENDSLLDDIVEYIHNHPKDDLSVKALCKRFFISRNALYKSFSNEYGCTVKEFTDKARINVASQQLLNTRARIMQIAEQTGFSSYTVFCKAFKQHFGVSPSEYRRQNKGNK